MCMFVCMANCVPCMMSKSRAEAWLERTVTNMPKRLEAGGNVSSHFSSIFLHITQEIGSLRTEVNQLAPAEEWFATHLCTTWALDFHTTRTNLEILGAAPSTLLRACAIPAFLNPPVLVSVLTDFCSNFSSVFYKMPCRAMVADRADVAENCRLFKDSGMKGNDLLDTLCW